MSGTVAEEPLVLSAVPGRMRVRLPAWAGRGRYWMEQQLRQTPGISHAGANPLTGNVLIVFDGQKTSRPTPPATLRTAQRGAAQAPQAGPPPPPRTAHNV